MSIFSGGFSADAVRGYVTSKRNRELDEKRAAEAAARAERDKLHAAFMERDVQPEALDRIATMVKRMADQGEKQALVLQFPSTWLPDSGRGITSHDPDWHQRLEGFPKRAYDFFQKELAPRGFGLRVEILDWPGGMPGDVGYFITWKRPEEE